MNMTKAEEKYVTSPVIGSQWTHENKTEWCSHFCVSLHIALLHISRANQTKGLKQLSDIMNQIEQSDLCSHKPPIQLNPLYTVGWFRMHV